MQFKSIHNAHNEQHENEKILTATHLTKTFQHLC